MHVVSLQCKTGQHTLCSLPLHLHALRPPVWAVGWLAPGRATHSDRPQHAGQLPAGGPPSCPSPSHLDPGSLKLPTKFMNRGGVASVPIYYVIFSPCALRSAPPYVHTYLQGQVFISTVLAPICIACAAVALQPALNFSPSLERHKKSWSSSSPRQSATVEFFYLDRRETPSYTGEEGLRERHIITPIPTQPASDRPTDRPTVALRLWDSPTVWLSSFFGLSTRACRPSPNTIIIRLFIARSSHEPQDHGRRQPAGLCPEVPAASAPARHKRRID